MATKKRTGYSVELRPNSIRIKFYIDGVCYRPTLTLNGKPLAPTAGNRNFAETEGERVARAIELGNFSWVKFFPDSPQAKEQMQANEAPVQTFGMVADQWLKSKGGKTAATRDQYGNAVKLWKSILGSDTPFERLTYQVLAAKIGGHPWASAKSCNNYMIAVRGIFEFHYHGPAALTNPLLNIKNMKLVKKLPDPLTAQERDMVLAYMREHYDPRVTAYFQFAFYTGMRPEELIALQWGDIDFNAKIARVQRVRTFRGSERDGSKTHSERDVDLVEQAMDALQTMKTFTFMKGVDADIFERPGFRPQKGSMGGKPSEAGPWMNEREQRENYWAPALRRLGIRSRRCYATRHTYATVLLMHGVPPAYIAHQLGHKNSKQVHEVYARWIEQADSGRARALMESAFGESEKAKTAPAPRKRAAGATKKTAAASPLKRVV